MRVLMRTAWRLISPQYVRKITKIEGIFLFPQTKLFTKRNAQLILMYKKTTRFNRSLYRNESPSNAMRCKDTTSVYWQCDQSEYVNVQSCERFKENKFPIVL